MDQETEPEKTESGKVLKLGRILSSAATVLLVLALCLCLLAVFQTSRQGYVSLGGRSLFRVVTGSMEPAIPQGALLMSKRVYIEDLRIGDVVCYQSHAADSDGMVITHRVVSIMRGTGGRLMLETQGDANTVPDSLLVTQEDLIGKVVWHTRRDSGLSRLLSFASDGIGFLALVAVPAFLIASGLLVHSIHSVRQELEGLNEALAQEKEKQELAKTQSPEIISQEELEELRREVWQELMAQRRELMQEILQELMQGEQHE